jgi:DNA-binding response OmpR family regulator
MGRRLLIVDDNPSVCEYLKDRLESMGYTVLAAYDGQTALVLMALEAKQAPIQGVMLDLHMPFMDGLEVLRELRTRHETVPIVMMTADPDSARRTEALALGAHHYVLKPIDPALLSEICHELFPLIDQEL